jgi:hypothetical protein
MCATKFWVYTDIVSMYIVLLFGLHLWNAMYRHTHLYTHAKATLHPLECSTLTAIHAFSFGAWFTYSYCQWVTGKATGYTMLFLCEQGLPLMVTSILTAVKWCYQMDRLYLPSFDNHRTLSFLQCCHRYFLGISWSDILYVTPEDKQFVNDMWAIGIRRRYAALQTMRLNSGDTALYNSSEESSIYHRHVTSVSTKRHTCIMGQCN